MNNNKTTSGKGSRETKENSSSDEVTGYHKTEGTNKVKETSRGTSDRLWRQRLLSGPIDLTVVPMTRPQS